MKYIAFAVLIAFSITAKAQKSQDPWLKRNWDNMIARYNIYFNATQKLESSVSKLADKQKDDFEKYLKVYPYGTEADAKEMRSSMEEVMKKASKVIQTKPRSKWADDAYFIIGQTHFFSGDYYAAIEAFQFVNANYTDPHIKSLSQLWLLKTYVQQKKYDDAEAILGLLKDIKTADKEFITHLNLTAGDLMVSQEKYPEAIKFYAKGIEKLKNRTLRYRAEFVMGQLNLATGNFRKANSHYIKVLKMNAPYEYVFQANLGMARATSQGGGAGIKNTKKYLKRMLSDDKNIEYFDQIYYELALLEMSLGNKQVGLENMYKSAANAKSNNTQRTKTYLYLADYFFANRNYSKAQAYYDSTVAVIPVDFPDVDKIKGQHAVLSKLIENIETIRLQDSLLALSRLDKAVLDKKITKIIEDEKERKRLEEEELAIRKEQERLNPTAGGGAGLPNAGAGAPGGIWYFYNQASIARGTSDFIRTWGNRSNGDWWRFINKSVVETAVPKQPAKDEPDEPEEDPDTYSGSNDKEQKEALKGLDEEKLKYYAPIPFSATAKLVAEKKIQDAYLGIGKVYFDDLKEYPKSIENFSTLLKRFPITKHKPEALFYLSKANSLTGKEAEAAKFAKQIGEEFPETAFNQVLNSKEILEDNSDAEVIAIYQKMYDAYQANKFDAVTAYKKQIDREYPGNSIQGKVDYLHALAIGKTQGREAYLKELAIVKDNYTGTEIGEMAAYTIRLLTEQKEDEVGANKPSIFNSSTDGIHYYIISGKTTKEKEVQLQIDEYNRQFFGKKTLQINSLILGDKQLFYIKQFDSKADAMNYHVELTSSQSFLTNAGLSEISIYAISEANFKTLVKNKNEQEYISFFNRIYK
jgi:tetratricopeptide (TPR) repeat protein